MTDPFKIHPPTIDRLSLSLVPENSRVCDLGCGNGRLGELMKKKLNCEVVGVEQDAQKAKTAALKIKKVIVGDLENPKIQSRILKEEKFDLIFASAILEHLKRPEEVLNNLKKALQKNGVVIITLPNIAYWPTRFKLLFGKFDYTQSGILDKTHLRFFTLPSAIKFIEKDCGLKIEAVDFEFPALPIIHRILKLMPFGDKIELKIYRLWPTFFVYQMVFKAKLR